MNRLPIKFEQEILSKHDIKWSDIGGYNHIQKLYGVRAGGPGIYTKQSDYAIAGIALEAMHKYCNDNALYLGCMIDDYINDDFFVIVFSAVSEIYGV